MSMTSRLPKRIRSAAAPALAAVILTAGVAAAAVLAGSAAMSNNDHRGDPLTYAGGQSTPPTSRSGRSPEGATIDWTIDELRTDLVGESPDVEGVFIELGDSHGQPLLQSGVAYRTGEGGLWFAPGQDARFGAVHGGTPGN
jgi:hypothetical protein